MNFDALKKLLARDGIPFAENEPMSRHTTFKIGGPARIFIMPGDTDSLVRAVSACREVGAQPRIIGNGSNLLVDDAGIDAPVISTVSVSEPVALEDGLLIASAGESMMSLCSRAQELGLSGLEFAYGIPGSVGGAVYMNAGAYGGEIKDVLTKAWAVNTESGELTEINSQEINFSYRHSIFMEKPYVIIKAGFSLASGDKDEIKAKMSGLMSQRKTKQPLDWPSAGSTFKRPQGAYAAALIDECGLKGFRVGGAAISEKHAGFVINAGGASCADVIKLMESVRETVLKQTGFELEPEIRVFR